MSTAITPWKPKAGLSPLEAKTKLEWADGIVKKAKDSFKDMAEALRHIKDTKAWEGRYDSFEECCAERWGFKKSTAYNIMKAESIQSALLEACKSEPIKNEIIGMTSAQLLAVDGEEPKEVVNTIANMRKNKEGRTASALKKKFNPSPVEILTPKDCICKYCHQPIKKPRPLPD